ncbi:MAG: DUF1593 domain-containing protein [Bacteroidales bacterium]|nr:MAG: DUF1593 domain-containing protein [Bacteroidales bacterium]
MKTKVSLLLRIVIPILIYPVLTEAQEMTRHRLVVLTDIEADPDDSQTLVRLLLYSNEIDIEGLIATTSTHQRTRVAPETIHKIIEAYAKVQPNLLKHDPGFPEAAVLHALVKQGFPIYGMGAVGEGKDSEGSDWIIRVLEKDDDRPLWVSVWGGPNTLAQALWKIRDTKNAGEAARLIGKLRVYTISDQDDSGPWMRKEFPDLFYVVSPGSYFAATWSAILREIPGANNEVISNTWLSENIQQGHGPLGAQYPDVAYGMEGDTPSWLSLIPSGLNPYWDDHPDYGGWGGRYELYTPDPQSPSPGMQRRDSPEPESRPIWTNADDTYRPRLPNYIGRAIVPDTAEYTGNHVTLWRWREDFQNDFAARMDWCVMSYEEANHPPVANLNQPTQFTVNSGDIFKLDADGSYDPDGDALSYWWFQYPEAGSYDGMVSFRPFAENLYNVHTIRAPEVESPKTVHFILKVTDKGIPALSRYKRIIITIVPE